MSLLIRQCKFNNYWRHTKFTNLRKIRELCVSSSNNLNISKHSCNIHATPDVPNDKIKRCLDYITNEYKNNTKISSILLDFIDLNTTSNLLKERIQLIENINSLQDLEKQDTEMKKLVEEEEALYKEQLNKLESRLLNIILMNACQENYKTVIIEITAGVGGQEAMLFVRNLYEMYIGYANYLGLDHDVIDIDINDNNGIRNVSIMLSGNEVSKLKYEGGVHRVQRIPVTEKSGRVHTSTASVAVLPAPSDIEIAIHEKDLKIETKRASGAGGQHVNTTDSAVRITHLPTGLFVTCQTQRSQIQNKQTALTKLRSMLYEQQLTKNTTFINKLRKKQMGAGLRNEKVRTYNYNQDRITDHRLQNGTLYNLQEFLQGGAKLEELENRLHNDMQMKMLLEIVEKLETQLK